MSEPSLIWDSRPSALKVWVQFTRPQGDYRFRSDLNGTQFWSGETDYCAIPGCEIAAITVTIPVTVTVQSQTGSPYPDLTVYAFSGESYIGFHGTTDENGETVFTLPQGDYRFRADYDGVQFWSGEVDHCMVPGCLEALVEIPSGVGEVSVTIDYTYDPLYRLTGADYSSGEYFHYTYDAVGNRLARETHEETNAYIYDDANRLIEVDGVTYTWDENGNLLSDDSRTYSYDHANRLTSVVLGTDTFNFSYNGMGDRLQQIVNDSPTDYTLDLSAGLTQVLADGSSFYLYGIDRLREEQVGGEQYHIADALGSVRQLVNDLGTVTRRKSYKPFGELLGATGLGGSIYAFTGEQKDETGLIYLRSRYLVPIQGRFATSDIWRGLYASPHTQNRFVYVVNNPTTYVDPSGLISQSEAREAEEIIDRLARYYGIVIRKDWGIADVTVSFYGSVSQTMCVWSPGSWREIRELRLVLKAVALTAGEMGGSENLRRAMK